MDKYSWVNVTDPRDHKAGDLLTLTATPGGPMVGLAVIRRVDYDGLRVQVEVINKAVAPEAV